MNSSHDCTNHEGRLKTLRVVSAVAIVSLLSANAYADHYGLDRLFGKFIFWCCVAGALLGIVAAVARFYLTGKNRDAVFTVTTLTGVAVFFLVLGDLWLAPFQFPLLFLVLLLLFAAQIATYSVTNVLLHAVLIEKRNVK